MSKSPVKRRWTIASFDGVGFITEQPPVRRVSPSTFADKRQHEGNNAALASTAALLRMVVAGALREVPPMKP